MKRLNILLFIVGVTIYPLSAETSNLSLMGSLTTNGVNSGGLRYDINNHLRIGGWAGAKITDTKFNWVLEFDAFVFKKTLGLFFLMAVSDEDISEMHPGLFLSFEKKLAEGIKLGIAPVLISFPNLESELELEILSEWRTFFVLDF